MPDFLKKFLDSISGVWNKLTLVQKLIGGGVVLAAIVAIILIFSFSSSPAGVPLFTTKLDPVEFGKITRKLQEDKIPFTTKGDSIILLRTEPEKNKTIMMLSQEGLMPKGKYNFLDIINSKNITSSKFENNIKLRAALEGKLEELLKSSDLIDDAKVSFTMPEQTVFVKERSPVKVAVMLTPKYGVNLAENKKAIKGIQELVINSIDRADPDYIAITDNYGVKLNDFSSDNEEQKLKTTKENLKIREAQIDSYRQKLYSGITSIIPADRLSIMVDVQMNFNEEKENRTEILPVVLKESDPTLPYDNGERKYSVTISKKTTSENFKGPNWVPEGPPGFDSNVPPAYKGALEQMTEYIKNEEITNEVTGESKKEIKKDPWDITKITASVIVDGTWEIEYDKKNKPVKLPDGTRKRKYIPVSADVLKRIQGFAEQGIGFTGARGDKVEVYEVAKDRSKEFEKEDQEWNRRNQLTWALIAGLCALILLIVMAIIYRIVGKELERRRRIKEEELARQHQLAREMALKSAEADNVDVEMSQEDKARLEMQETAINISREHPEEVAQLIRTWLTEE
jgi:flagellar M-ring protein FliF